jgi:hypothetical protein
METVDDGCVENISPQEDPIGAGREKFVKLAIHGDPQILLVSMHDM